MVALLTLLGWREAIEECFTVAGPGYTTTELGGKLFSHVVTPLDSTVKGMNEEPLTPSSNAP